MATQEVNFDPALGALVGLTLTSSKPEERRQHMVPSFSHVHAGGPAHSQNHLVMQMYSHIKHCQRLDQQRKSKAARAEKSRRRKTNTSVTSPTFTVDLSSGRWLSGDLSSTGRSCSLKLTDQKRTANPHPTGNAHDSEDSLLDLADTRSGHAEGYSDDNQRQRSSPDGDHSAASHRNVQGSESARRHLANSPRGQVHWNSVQPGSLTPARVTVVTIDGRKFM